MSLEIVCAENWSRTKVEYKHLLKILQAVKQHRICAMYVCKLILMLLILKMFGAKKSVQCSSFQNFGPSYGVILCLPLIGIKMSFLAF